MSKSFSQRASCILPWTLGSSAALLSLRSCNCEQTWWSASAAFDSQRKQMPAVFRHWLDKQGFRRYRIERSERFYCCEGNNTNTPSNRGRSTQSRHCCWLTASRWVLLEIFTAHILGSDLELPRNHIYMVPGGWCTLLDIAPKQLTGKQQVNKKGR